MAISNVLKFAEKINNDNDFREKIVEAEKKTIDKYGAELTEDQRDAAFDEFYAPVAAEAGIPITAAEFKGFFQNYANSDEISEDELKAISGGGEGWGFSLCYVMGIGAGHTIDTSEDGAQTCCIVLGGGGTYGICFSSGAVGTF